MVLRGRSRTAERIQKDWTVVFMINRAGEEGERRERQHLYELCTHDCHRNSMSLESKICTALLTTSLVAVYIILTTFFSPHHLLTQLRVGKVISVSPHPDPQALNLVVTTVDLGPAVGIRCVFLSDCARVCWVGLC